MVGRAGGYHITIDHQQQQWDHLFGLRIRMPASRDLYDMLLQYFIDAIEPIVPHEIDPVRFPIHPGKSIHTVTIHLIKRRSDTMSIAIQ